MRNLGKAPLAVGPLSVPDGFTVIEGLATTIPPRGFDNFTVQLDSSILGEFTGEISLVSNDADENPFNFSIRSVVAVAPVPQIAVQLNGTELISGASTVIDLGSVAFHKKGSTITLTIQNDGDGDLHLLSIELPTGFVLAKRPPHQVAAQRSAFLQVRLDSRVIGLHAGQLVIHSDDADQASFVIAIQGSVLG